MSGRHVRRVHTTSTDPWTQAKHLGRIPLPGECPACEPREYAERYAKHRADKEPS